MSRTSLKNYFVGLIYKRLSAVESNLNRSHQHEFNGTERMKNLLGTDKRVFKTRLLYLDDSGVEPETSIADLTWYDAREDHPTRSEFRLYFPSTPVTERASEGDLLVIARRPDDTLLLVVTRSGSTAENQVRLLFDLQVSAAKFTLKNVEDTQSVDTARAIILEQLGIEAGETRDDYLDVMLKRFPNGFPSTKEFSAFARSTVPGISSLDDPDRALLEWWEREESLFRTLERNLVRDRLRSGFGEDVDQFIQYSLTVLNTRKARAGHALENHLEQVWKDHSILYDHGQKTEGQSRPDFLFPSATAYHNKSFPSSGLTMLGVKASCKDRWRQILAEAERLEEKHLFTLEAAISENQTEEMKSQKVQLILPGELHASYSVGQRSWLLSLRDFVTLLKRKQADGPS